MLVMLVKSSELPAKKTYGYSERNKEQRVEFREKPSQIDKKKIVYIGHQDVTLEQLLLKSATKGRIYGEHLHWQLSKLQQEPELLTALVQVASSSIPIELDRIQALKLRNMGLVHLIGDRVVPRCNLYRLYRQSFSQSCPVGSQSVKELTEHFD
jgi:AAA-like domain